MKISIINSALLVITGLIVGTTSSVHADQVTPGISNAKINFFHNDGGSTDPLDPSNPDNPNPSQPIDPDDPDNNGTGNKGPLTVDYVSNVDFGKSFITGDIITLKAINKNPFIQVSDWREAGNGWTMTASMTKPFTNSANGLKLNGAVMKWSHGIVKSKTGNGSIAPTATDFSLDKSAASAIVMTASDDKTGKGTWLDTFEGSNTPDAKKDAGERLGGNEKVTMSVPTSEVENGEYTAELTWTLTDTPR
ncbi:hypothetical protein RD055328_12240 [Companilactobacillus sp. RD055328]|uniref:WxL domain-containing protein n=1 Tax=Companilactobacillus sp. RD055328 TaxID=2916634 RepID=UPI001FC7DEF1|nr:WxL domain-containing protein [Companilactobacillus sp. RD055328]GKQ43301.1 hypothetical protein RD055328_12240 [Companilactobacillus sp. RD055328]